MYKLVLHGALPNGLSRKLSDAGWLDSRTAKAREYVEDMIRQARNQWAKIPIDRKVALQAAVFCKDNRFSLDDIPLCRVLEEAGVIKNGGLVSRKVLEKRIDTSNPRVEIEITLYDSKSNVISNIKEDDMKNRMLRLKDVVIKTGVKRAAIYNKISEGLFPPPVKCGKMSLWPEEEIDEMIKAWIKGLDKKSIERLVKGIEEKRRMFTIFRRESPPF